MDQFESDVLARLPLATAVWTLFRHVASDETLGELFERHRGSGCEREVSFSLLVQLVCEALLEHRGSGRRSFDAARKTGRLSASNESVYGRLRRLRPELSMALLREATRRLREALPEGASDEIPPALAGYRILVVDGKKLKGLPKRLAALRQVSGKLLGGKVLAGLLLNDGLVVAIEATPDGEANDAPLTPALIEQCAAEFPGPLLYVADRQFCDLKIPNLIAQSQQAFVIRYTKKMRFEPEKEQLLCDAQGRAVREAWGWLGSSRDARRMYLRQITLERGDDEAVILVTNLLDAEQAPATQLLDVYLARWSIERVFQQVTEVFGLEQFIGSTPQGAIFQFSLCCLLYNLIQAVRAYIGEAQQRPARQLSSEMIFRSVCDELTAASVLVPAARLEQTLGPKQTSSQVRAQLRTLLAAPWSQLWIKCPAKKKTPPAPKRKIPGNHSSAWKLLQANKPQPPPR